jgi:YHS domain-containing protein
MNYIAFLLNRLLGVFVALLLLQSVAWSADSPVFGVAAQGYDVVGYFTDNKPVKGSGDHVARINGLDYLFASDEHKKAFLANPDKYMPQYGGWCAFGTSVGKKIPGDPLAWAIVNGKLYLNLNDRVQKIWSKDMQGYITRADANWLQIKDKDPSSL